MDTDNRYHRQYTDYFSENMAVLISKMLFGPYLIYLLLMDIYSVYYIV